MRLTIDTSLNLYRLLPLLLILWPTGNAAADRLIAHYTPRTEISSEAETYLSEGDTVAGYVVSSGYNLERVHPVKGTVEPHYGIDLATPTGTKILSPEQISVVCWWDAQGGGEVATITMRDGQQFQLLHLSSCLGGSFPQGITFARTGSSGLGTGAHLDVRRMDKTEPTKEDVEPFLTGKPSLPLLSDRELTCSIGAAEGTRNSDCQPNRYYNGHIDPGNGANNLGTFSYQHGAPSPEAADRRQLVRLREAEKRIQAQADQKFGRPLSKESLASALDLWNQSPEAGNDFVRHLPSPAPTMAEIIEARSRSYIDPQTGVLDAPGLGDAEAVEVDQTRRTKAIDSQIEREYSSQRRRLERLDK
ncbi:MAG: peptidoglycan DD-metalloendopeptidase family protein [Phormidesmis sp.]